MRKFLLRDNDSVTKVERAACFIFDNLQLKATAISALVDCTNYGPVVPTGCLSISMQRLSDTLLDPLGRWDSRSL